MSWAQLRAPALIAVLALLWGSGFFWIKLSLAGLSPFQLTFMRLALGAAVLGLVVAARRLALPRGLRMWGHLVVAALISNAVPYTLFAVAEQTVPSNLAGTVNATTPLWTAVIAFVAGADRLRSPGRAVGLILGFVGALLLLSPWSAASGGSVLGAVACLGAAVSYGLSYVYQARYITNRGFPPLVLAFGQLCAAAAILAVVLPITWDGAPRLDGMVLPAILTLGILGTGLAYVLNYALITTEGPTAASVVTYLVPAVSVVLGAAFLSEPAGPTCSAVPCLFCWALPSYSAAGLPRAVTEAVYRKQIRPVIEQGAAAMDRIFPPQQAEISNPRRGAPPMPGRRARPAGRQRGLRLVGPGQPEPCGCR